jgi:alanine racemase
MSLSCRCWAEVDLDALRGNLAWIRHRVGRDVRVLAVVKADAYGHGLKQIAALLMQSGADLFGVANLSEAQSIHSVGAGWPVLMLGACLPGEVDAAVRDGVTPTISSLDEARLFSAAAAKRRVTVAVHVKVDTGMGRLGVPVGSAVRLVAAIARLPSLRCEGIYTHYSAAEDDRDFSRTQAERFAQVITALRARGLCPPLVHANNSAALLHEPATIYNVVRPGLLIYGIAPPGGPGDASGICRHLRPALSFKCRVSLVKSVPKGTPLSYGGNFVSARAMRVATLTAGYGDGYLRSASNRSSVLVHGRRCRVLGRITMDQMLVDVTGLRGVRAGDEAVLIGKQKGGEITATELAAWCGTVPWEVLTAITYRVPRLYRGGQAS